ncbi:MAG: hypothetical protein NT167_19540, partial [Verrucomicrobia bacterium]|nr:hypothetical protein [Verrucomicrobiota bacterium]
LPFGRGEGAASAALGEVYAADSSVMPRDLASGGDARLRSAQCLRAPRNQIPAVILERERDRHPRRPIVDLLMR